MDYLETEEARKYRDIKFDRCVAVKLFYVIYGRNAWFSTWVKKYSPGCMNSTYESAKQAAEKKRVQGSVFYIEELPALQFINRMVSVFVTEINTDFPLQHYVELHERPTCELMDVFEHFATDKPNSVIRLIWHRCTPMVKDGKPVFATNDFDCLERLKASQEFKIFTSFTNGPGYYLGWRESANKQKSDAVHLLAKTFDSMIKAYSDRAKLRLRKYIEAWRERRK